jgi:hypothetical protein
MPHDGNNDMQGNTNFIALRRLTMQYEVDITLLYFVVTEGHFVVVSHWSFVIWWY